MRANEARVNRYKRLIDQHRAEGGPITEFCKRHGISHWTFRDWRRRLGAKDAGVLRGCSTPRAAAGALPAFLPVVTPTLGSSEVAAQGYDVTLSSGTHLRIPAGYDKAELRTLLRLLRA